MLENENPENEVTDTTPNTTEGSTAEPQGTTDTQVETKPASLASLVKERIGIDVADDDTFVSNYRNMDAEVKAYREREDRLKASEAKLILADLVETGKFDEYSSLKKLIGEDGVVTNPLALVKAKFEAETKAKDPNISANKVNLLWEDYKEKTIGDQDFSIEPDADEDPEGWKAYYNWKNVAVNDAREWASKSIKEITDTIAATKQTETSTQNQLTEQQLKDHYDQYYDSAIKTVSKPIEVKIEGVDKPLQLPITLPADKIKQQEMVSPWPIIMDRWGMTENSLTPNNVEQVAYDLAFLNNKEQIVAAAYEQGKQAERTARLDQLRNSGATNETIGNVTGDASQPKSGITVTYKDGRPYNPYSR